jgi:hypothetical protein
VAVRQIYLTGDAQLRANLARLGAAAGSAALAKAVNRTAFEVRLDEGAEIRRSLTFAGPATEGFLAQRGVVFDAATAADLTAIVRPNTKTEPILFDQATGPTITAADTNQRLGLRGDLAVPVNVKRGPRGRVAPSETPGRLLHRYGRPGGKRRSTRGVFAGTASAQSQATAARRVFVNRAGTVILEAIAGTLRVLYALVPRAKLEARFDFLGAAERSARQHFPLKVEDELRKVLGTLRP